MADWVACKANDNFNNISTCLNLNSISYFQIDIDTNDSWNNKLTFFFENGLSIYSSVSKSLSEHQIISNLQKIREEDTDIISCDEFFNKISVISSF